MLMDKRRSGTDCPPRRSPKRSLECTGLLSVTFVLALAAAADASESSPGQSPAEEVDGDQRAACSTPDHRRFDFWIGEWRVSSEGRRAGENRITSALGGCTLEEHWRGAEGSQGRSLTFYDASRDVWHQTWIDAGGRPLYLEGGWTGKAMRLEGDGLDSRGRPIRHRITWTPLADGAVRQHWEYTRDGSEWQTLFDGRYERL